jgi:internalin A
MNGKKASSPAPKRTPPPLRLFISYAHADHEYLQPFRNHLKLLIDRGYVDIWHDGELIAGENWEAEINRELRKAEIVLLFYSTAARVSEFIQKKELPVCLRRSDKGLCTLIWVPLERKDLEKAHPLELRLRKLACATRNMVPIYDNPMPLLRWVEVEQAIRDAVQARRKRASKGGTLGIAKWC